MTLNRLVRNLAIGAVLYAGCGDGDKTTVNNNYSGRDGGSQSGGGRNLLSELCEKICSRDTGCVYEFFDDRENYESPNFPCYNVCTSHFSELVKRPDLIRIIIKCIDLSNCEGEGWENCMDENFYKNS